MARRRHAGAIEGLTLPNRLELRSVSKRYHGTAANDCVSLGVLGGEIHAVLGENGAGKSTLMKIIYGAVAADSGEMLWEGVPVAIDSPAAARRLGIGMVYQHFSLFESVSVAENIAVALDGPFDLAALSARIADLGVRYGLPVDPSRLLHHLSVGERQRVEILRCLLQNPRLLILDEPTSVLSPPEARAPVRGAAAPRGRRLQHPVHHATSSRRSASFATGRRSCAPAALSAPPIRRRRARRTLRA